MKKQIKKLNLSKRTISNLNAPEMSEKHGGQYTFGCTGGTCHCNTTHCTIKGNTCYNHNTCNTCV